MSTQEKLEEFLVWVMANRDVHSRRWADEIEPELKRQLTELIDSAKREGFLEGQLESLGKVTKENFMYRCLYGELPLDYKGVDLLEAYKSYRENDSFRENFARYVEQVAVELEQSEESE